MASSVALLIFFCLALASSATVCKTCSRCTYQFTGTSRFVQDVSFHFVVPNDTMTRPGSSQSFSSDFTVTSGNSPFSAPVTYLGFLTNTGGDVNFQTAELKDASGNRLLFDGDAPFTGTTVYGVTGGTGVFLGATGTVAETPRGDSGIYDLVVNAQV